MEQASERLRAALAQRYHLDRQLGRGGMATVYLAEDLKHHRQVAIKVLKPELAAMIGAERFLREIEIAAKLNHPHILPLFDSGEADGLLYYVMPYVEGESLRERLNRHKQLPLDDAVQIAREVADALDYAHRHDVVHRDIKPENILLADHHAVVADFGVARAIHAAGGENLTETGIAIGTPAYMSPEQASGSDELDGRSDAYSLACVLYEMLAGQPPFTGPTAESVIHQHLAAEAPRITVLRPAVPAWLTAALTRALAKIAADRFSRAALFAASLAPPEPAAIPGAVPAQVAPRGWRVRALPLLGVAMFALIGGTLLVLRSGPDPPEVTRPTYERTAIAVLPFQNLSADGPNSYFAGGLHDEILTQLSKSSALSLRGRTSVMGYAGTTRSVKQIAQDLEVGSLVEGSVQVVGNRLRVNVQLIDAATDEHVWAERYDGSLDDAFAIQSDIAHKIVAAVGVALSGVEQPAGAKAPTTDAEAYRLYLQGRQYIERPGYLRQNYEAAQALYERALERDPNFALAHAALSIVHGLMYWLRYDASETRAARQRAEAEAALRLAPHLPQAHIAMGLVHYWGRRDYRRALGELAIAREALPNESRLAFSIGLVQRRLGNWDEALAAFHKAAELDPRDAVSFVELAATYKLIKRYAEAIRNYDRALSLAPDFHFSAVEKGQTYFRWQGQLDTLRSILSRVPRDAGLASVGTKTAIQLQILHWERKPDSMLRIVTTEDLPVFDGQAQFVPRVMYAAWAHELRHDGPAARASFDSALGILDSVLKDLPDDWRLHATRGLALGGLGRREEALREARWLMHSVAYRDDAHDRVVVAEERARILAQAREADAALDEITPLLTGPSFLSIHVLQLDPLWDPIRGHPRFKALLARYAGQ